MLLKERRVMLAASYLLLQLRHHYHTQKITLEHHHWMGGLSSGAGLLGSYSDSYVFFYRFGHGGGKDITYPNEQYLLLQLIQPRMQREKELSMLSSTYIITPVSMGAQHTFLD
jgi:prolipoprotein diacylglyceryltransferase